MSQTFEAAFIMWVLIYELTLSGNRACVKLENSAAKDELRLHKSVTLVKVFWLLCLTHVEENLNSITNGYLCLSHWNMSWDWMCRLCAWHHSLEWTLGVLGHWILAGIPRSSLLFSHPVVSNSLQPRGPQHARPPCSSPSPKVCPSSCPLHQ